MTPEQKLYFRNQLREARANALQDAEAFDDIVHALERIGNLLRGETTSFGSLEKYRKFILREAKSSPLAEQIPLKWSEIHIDFYSLYELVRLGRNKAMHEGSFARHLTTRAVELSIILEHALMEEFNYVSHFMVENPVCAALWQPLSFIRQSMLKNSFSYLPVLVVEDGERVWRLISDLALARYLQSNKDETTKRLSQQLGNAIESKSVKLNKTRICKPNESVVGVLKDWDGLPILVQSKHSDELIGILTPFDLL